MTIMQRQIQQKRAAAAGATDLLSKFFYGYSATVSALASAASGSDTIKIQADSAYLVQALVCFAFNTVTFAEITSPIATVQVTDTGSGTQLFDNPQFIRNVFGTATLPFLMPTPRMLSPNSSLLVTVNNLNSANAVTYQFGFLGQKLYR